MNNEERRTTTVPKYCAYCSDMLMSTIYWKAEQPDLQYCSQGCMDDANSEKATGSFDKFVKSQITGGRAGEKYRKLLSDKDAEIQRLRDEAKKVSDYWSKRAAEYINEIHRLKEEVALHEKWKNDTLNDLVTYKAHKDKEIQQLKAATPKELYKRNQRQEKMIETLQAEIQHLKYSRVKDIEDAWDACHAWCLWEFDRSERQSPDRDEYLKSFQEVNNKK
jgi:hypothetical protein